MALLTNANGHMQPPSMANPIPTTGPIADACSGVRKRAPRQHAGGGTDERPDGDEALAAKGLPHDNPKTRVPTPTIRMPCLGRPLAPIPVQNGSGINQLSQHLADKTAARGDYIWPGADGAGGRSNDLTSSGTSPNWVASMQRMRSFRKLN